MTLDAVEKEFIRMTLESTGGNKKEAAAILNISRRALYNKLRDRIGRNLRPVTIKKSLLATHFQS